MRSSKHGSHVAPSNFPVASAMMTVTGKVVFEVQRQLTAVVVEIHGCNPQDVRPMQVNSYAGDGPTMSQKIGDSPSNDVARTV